MNNDNLNPLSSTMKFSILLSLYAGEKPAYLEQALHSLTISTVPIDEIIIVLDGPITDQQNSVLGIFEDRLPLFFLSLEKNVGLGKALNAGLKACRNEWVARFDTDDIIAPYRFERQLSFIEENPDVDIVGSWISEFSESSYSPTGIRKLPLSHNDISKFAQRRCPFNHMTVMYRRCMVLKAGSYQGEHLYEDYALWIRMLQAGAKAANIPECLVKVRAGNDMVKRRGGLKYALSEYKAQRAFHNNGFISKSRFFLNIMQRIPVRLLPGNARAYIYNLVLRNSYNSK